MFAWLSAGLFVGALSAAGFAYYWAAAVLGVSAGVLLVIKFANDTENDPAEALYFCDKCKHYFKASSIAAAKGTESEQSGR